MYKVKNHPLVEEDLKKLDHSVRILVFKQLKKLENSPKLGELLGNKNNLDLSGLYKMYVAKKRVRIVYEIVENELIVYVIAIGKRDEMDIYKKASKRR